MKSKLFISIALLIAVSLLLIPSARGQNGTYYLGDAIIYKNQVVIGSTNLGDGLELFKLENNKLVRAGGIKPVKALYSTADNFYDLAFSQEDERLYVYLVDGRYLSKYDISNLAAPALVSKIKDNGWDYFMGVDLVDNKIITYGVKGTKVWNLAGQIIDSYEVINQYAYNINYQSNNFIFDAQADRLKFFDKNTRQFFKETPFALGEIHNRKTFADQIGQAVYLVDDSSLKKFDYSGELKNVFKHISNRGYDVDGFSDQDHLYFSDGVGIVKFSKADLKPLSWAYTADLGETNGWAMGLKVLRDDSGEKIVVFNNSSILLLDENLKMISHVAAGAIEVQTPGDLFLSLDQNRAVPLTLVSLSGGGYASGEDLLITFAGQNFSAKADCSGRFIKALTVPEAEPGRVEIKVVGRSSDLHYSISFNIE